MATFWGPDFDELSERDPDIAAVLLAELGRVRGGLQLIASENLTSPAVLAALGSTLTNKYAEGYPGRRYYGGGTGGGPAQGRGAGGAQAGPLGRAPDPPPPTQGGAAPGRAPPPFLPAPPRP